MVGFVFKFLCIFYVAVLVNTRTIISNSENGKFGDIFSFLNRKDTTDRSNDKREARYTEIDKILANVTDNVNILKDKYGKDRYKALLPILDKIIYEYSPPKTTIKMTTVASTENIDFLGTEQIEALLNDIKARAIEMVAEQSPSVTDIISNTVTEATFEADPILTHLDMSSPGYALTTFVCLNNIENMNVENKRTANDSNTILISNKNKKHDVSVRSVKEDAYTIAQNMEDMLQKELKSIYKKVKNKVSKDFNKEVNAAKSTLKCESSKIITKISKKITGLTKTTPLTTSHKAKTAPRHNREFKTTKAMAKSTKQPDATTSTPTIDDFAMLTLYEQILAKTHEDNVMKMLTTSKKRKVDEAVRLSKRNPETLTDLTLKEDIKRMNDDGETIPDFDYNNDIILPETSSDYLSDLEKLIWKSIQTSVKYSTGTSTTDEPPVEDTSFEGLSEKIAYKDYVNGYKSYLNFQKDQAKQNFSALVKYQAHRHHKVDDIGKFILNKIPQIPQETKRRKRYFFDDSDMDEQDISTKSDDSWFKKHFYMFIDSGPQRKFHTSETVEFKDATEVSRGYADSTEKFNFNTVNPEAERTSDADQTVDINLDELSKSLGVSRVATGVSILKTAGNFNSGSNQFKSASSVINSADNAKTSESNQYKIEDGGITFQVFSPNIISKFFGKGRRNPAKDEEYEDNTLKYDDDSFLFNSDLDRFKRNARNQIKATERENDNLAQTTIHKQDKKHDKTNSYDKVGCVSIVTQATAIVNLHKPNVKGSKIKSLLSKLHFYKRNKMKKKEKRHCTRVQRFNPIKKLRDMFKLRQDGRDMDTNNDVIADYDMITSRIDTFKPVKYDKIPSIEELKNQVPNISGDFATNQAEKTVVDKPKLVRYNAKKINNILTDWDNSASTKSHSVIPSSDTTLQRPKPQSTVKSYTQNMLADLALKELAVTDDILNVNVKTLPKFEELYTPVTLENISNEITKIQTKLSTEDELTDFSTSPKSKVTEKPKPNDKTYDKEYDKVFNDDITIKAKLTRIAKYPIIAKHKYNFTEMIPVGDKTKLYEFVDNNSYLNVHENDKNAHEESYPTQNAPFFDIQYSTIAKPNVVTATSPNNFVIKTLENIKDFNPKLSDAISKYKTYPDYFHDLVMWNSDILNYDKVSNPTWQDFLKNIESDQEFTTPSIRDIQREVNEIKEHFKGDELGPKDIENMKIETAIETTPRSLSSPRYVAKASNIKVEVTSKTMKNHPHAVDSFENLYNVPKNEPVKYNNVKSQDIIDVLNKLNYQKPYKPSTESNWKINEGPPRSTSDVDEPDTTSMSYANDLNFVNDNTYTMKISKNSLRSFNHKKQESHPISKVNQQPKQYYNTPLPMRNEQFEKFLKENKLDVESVTLPMIEMPTITETWHSKINPLAKTIQFDEHMKVATTIDKTKINDNKETTTVGYKNGVNEQVVEMVDKSYPDNQIEYLNDLENDLFNDYRDNVNARHKRSSVNDYNMLTENALISNEELQMITHNINEMFEKSLEVSTDMMKLNSVTPNENEVEITIINFDDADKKLEFNKPITNPEEVLMKVKSTKLKDKTLARIATSDSNKTQAISETENDKQLYNRNLETKDDESETNPNNGAQLNIKADPEIKDKTVFMNLNKLPNEVSGNYKNTQGNLPKRVQISSHSYKYDVLYNVPKNKANAPDEEDDVYVKEVTTPAHNTDIKRDYYYKESTNSEIHQIMIVVDVVDAVNDFTRPDSPIHIDLPTYYAPNPEIDTTKLLPASLKTSWTDLVLKYISGIALIEMINKLGVLKGGLNLTDGIDVTLDRGQVFSIDGVMADGGNSRVDRAGTHKVNKVDDHTRDKRDEIKVINNILAKTTKRHTFSQTIHFPRDMKRQRNKRLFKILPVIKEKLRLFAKHKSTTLMMTPANTMEILKQMSTDKSLMSIDTTTEFTTRSGRNFKTSDNSYDIFDYKGDIDDENKKAAEPTFHPIFIITNKQMDNGKTKPKIKPIDDEGVYVEEYDNQVYYEPGSKPNKVANKTKIRSYETDGNVKEKSKKDTNFNSYSKPKRDVSQETFTAKNVAALEVIVDLMKNTPSFEEKNMIKMISQSKVMAAQRTKPRKNTNESMEHITNSIQVHIAIPYDVPDKRRSLDPLKVRKVFSAKMSTPVDLEYQIHSIEDNIATAAVSPDLDGGFTPGMYLLVEDENTLKNSFSLKPIADPSIHMRNADDITKKVEVTTKKESVKLSKEFVAAVNKHLVELYKNMTATTKRHTVKRRETSWNIIKKLFGHDRVCNCKCKENKTMCRACAASDAVIKELTFEFDNLAKYMSDHCTEIQTFFWMNPTGGRKLRDAVHRIDKSLDDYYKRVRGKCQGRTCKTFATYIDKRDFDKNKKDSSYIGEPLIDDLDSLNTIFGLSSNFIPYDGTLKEKVAEFVKTASNCITLKPISKRSSINNVMKRNYDKEVYTLDNISVNIICNPEASTASTQTSPVSLVDSTNIEGENSNIFLDYDVNKRNCKKFKLKNLFRRKNKVKLDKLFTYYDTKVTARDNFKREAIYKQIESPIIADTGGSFWHDYLSKGNVDASNDNSKPNVDIAVVQTTSAKTPVTQDSVKVSDSLKNKLKSIYKSKNKVTLSTPARAEITNNVTDSLSYNMNELFKLIGTIQDVEDARNTFTDPTIVTQYHTKKHKTKKVKTKKHKKTNKTSKCKITHKYKTEKTNMTTDIKNTPPNTFNTTYGNTSKAVDLNEIKTTTEPKTTTTNTFDSFSIEEFTPSLKETRTNAKESTTKKNLFNKIKTATLGFLNKIGKGNRVIDSPTSNTLIDEESQTKTVTTAASTKDKAKKLDSNVISEVTSKLNPTILIINEDTTHAYDTKEKSKYKNILLSLINYERGKLDKERKSLDEEFEKEMDEANLVENISVEDLDDIEHTLLGLKLQSTMTTAKPLQQNIDYDIFQSLKSIRPQLENLEIPAPANLQSHPGLLEKLVHQFGIKVINEKEVTKTTLKPMVKHNYVMTEEKKGNRKWYQFEEADPIKISNFNIHDNGQSNDLKKFYENDVTGRQRSKKPRKRSDSYTNSDSRIHLEESNTKEKFTKDRKVETFVRKPMKSTKNTLQRTEFDRFIREENGIYRLKRYEEPTTNAIAKLTEIRKQDSVYTNSLRNQITVGFVKERRKRKRSSSAERIQSNRRLTVWMQHNTGFFLATATCLYIVFALFAAVVNWFFQR